MQAIIGIFIRMFAAFLPQMVVSVLKWLGFTAVTYVGVSTAMSFAKSYIYSKLGSIDNGWLEIAGLLQIDTCINILFSAYVARAVMWGMNKAGSKSSIVFRGK